MNEKFTGIISPSVLSDYTENDIRLLSNGKRKNVMRNRPCICGSGKKFKQCCWKIVPQLFKGTIKIEAKEENNG